MRSWHATCNLSGHRPILAVHCTQSVKITRCRAGHSASHWGAARHVGLLAAVVVLSSPHLCDASELQPARTASGALLPAHAGVPAQARSLQDAWSRCRFVTVHEQNVSVRFSKARHALRTQGAPPCNASTRPSQVACGSATPRSRAWPRQRSSGPRSTCRRGRTRRTRAPTRLRR